MFPRLLASASLAAALLATDILLLVLFLNPDLGVARELPALLADLFAPYALALTFVLSGVALLGATVRFWPRALRPRVEGLPFFTSLTSLAILTAAVLFWYNLFVYRYAIPLDHVRGLARSAIALTGAWLVLVAVMVDALIFPLRGRGSRRRWSSSATPRGLSFRSPSVPGPRPPRSRCPWRRSGSF